MRVALSVVAALVVAVASANCGSGSTRGSATDAGTTNSGDAGGLPGLPDSGGVNAEECAGLSPGAVGQPSASVAIKSVGYDQWSAGRTDGSGTVALLRTNDNQPPPFTLHLFDPSGVERGRYQSVDTSLGEVVLEQREGFEVSGYDFYAGGGYLAAIDPNGSVIATSGNSGEFAGPVANDPLGGIVMVLRRTGETSSPVIAAYDERLNLRFRTRLPSNERPFALGVDRQGNTLVLLDAADRFGSGRAGGIWIDHSGKAGMEFQALEGIGSSPVLALTPRVGRGLFAERDRGFPTAAAWIRQFDAMGEGTAPPDWLAARPATELRIVRTGRAYAVVHPPRSDGVCHADIEVVAPSGKSCGTAMFPAEQSGAYCAGSVAVGYDGTVVRAVVQGVGGDRRFTFSWWTGFLR